MSTFAVFGMTQDVAKAEAKKRVKGTRKNLQAPGGVEQIPLIEWLAMVDKKTEQIMTGTMVRQLSPMFDAPPVRPAVYRLGSKDFALS